MKLVVIVFLTLFLLSGIVMVQREAAAVELIRMDRPLDMEFLIDFYAPVPHLGEPVAGKPDAPIAFVIQMDPASAEARIFKRDIYPKLEAEYIDTGVVRYYEKAAITAKDIEEWTPEAAYDAFDTVRGRVAGTSPILYIGIGSKDQIIGLLSWEKLTKALRYYQIQLGD